MKKRSAISCLSALFLVMAFASCIKNDVPYPRIRQEILSLAAEGESLPAVIDVENLKATVYLEEDVDIRAVRFAEFTFTEGASCSTDLLSGSFDLASPLNIVISRYQDYTWTVSAVQEIERRFSIEGQMGETVIDVPGRRIVVRVPDSENLAYLNLTSLKLGPDGITTLSPDVKPGRINLVRPLEIDVTVHGRTERWTVYVEKVDFVVNTVSADAWSKVVWVYGESQEGLKQGFQYRQAGSEEWIDVPESSVVSDGTSFSACIPRLEPLTEYVVRAVAGEDFGSEIHVTTQSTELIPNGSFDQWSLNGKVWQPWNEGGLQFWDTGNKGATMAGNSNSVPSDYTPDGKGKSARLETVFASVFNIGKIAAGNIFTGTYLRTSGTNGVLAFGQPWNLRPTRLRGYFQYQAKDINKSDTDHGYLVGRPDSCHIYVALADWTAPYEIRTEPNNRQLFDPALPSIIAYGELIYSGTMDSYKEFVIPLEYRSTSRVPTYMQITVSSSKYGDFFTGGEGSLLYVDQLSFDYDY